MNVVADHLSRKFIGAVEDEWQLYSNNAADYEINSPIGFGASSVVYDAKYTPADGGEPVSCAIKVLDLDRLPPSALRLLRNETQLMSLSKHPNVLRVRGIWVVGHKLFIAMRLMSAGSVADVMRYQWPGGLEEEVIRCILKQALQGLNYFHINGLIHRDVKAANLLIDDDGTVLLGDLGVAAFLWDSEATNSSKSRSIIFDDLTRHSHINRSRPLATPSQQRPSILGKRKSFVGTPCWMAPEIINGKQYDASADIWSFGITAIELAQGRAPRSRLDPQRVLVMTVTEAPPQLDRKAGTYHYSSTFAEIVALCLHKDPSQRPTASVLLQMPFFRNARKPSYLCSGILRGLPPLTSRQERRKQPSLLTHSTIDSWDFTSSLPTSPTASVYSHQRRPLVLLPPASMFAMEDEQGGEEHATPTPGDNGGPHGNYDNAAFDARSSAEAYVVQVRADSRSIVGRAHSLHHSESNYHSRHSQHQSHDDSQPSVYSVDEGVGMAEESPERDEATPCQAIPVAVPLQKGNPTTLDVPVSSTGLSTSPSPSYRSSASVTSSTSSPLVPTTPPSSSFVNSAKSQPVKLWRKLAGKLDSESEKDKDVPPTPIAGARKRSFGNVLGRTAHVGADLVRTASRSMSSHKQTR